MLPSAPVRSQQSYRHEAFFYADAMEFLQGTVPFIVDGLDAGEPVMVATVREHTAWLRSALGRRAHEVHLVDMRELGRNPACIIPAWLEFVSEHSAQGLPCRGIGEPIWPDRSAPELLECQLHEALLNVAVDPQHPFWLLCPYDVTRLDPDVLEEAQRSHPAVLEREEYRGSSRYAGRAHVELLFGAALPAPAGRPAVFGFGRHTLQDVYAFVTLHAYAAGLWSDKAADLATAARRLVASSLHRGAERGTLRIWNSPDSLICDVSDPTVVNNVLAGRLPPAAEENNSLWAANQSCDLVQMRSGSGGTVVRLHAWK